MEYTRLEILGASSRTTQSSPHIVFNRSDRAIRLHLRLTMIMLRRSMPLLSLARCLFAEDLHYSRVGAQSFWRITFGFWKIIFSGVYCLGWTYSEKEGGDFPPDL